MNLRELLLQNLDFKELRLLEDWDIRLIIIENRGPSKNITKILDIIWDLFLERYGETGWSSLEVWELSSVYNALTKRRWKKQLKRFPFQTWFINTYNSEFFNNEIITRELKEEEYRSLILFIHFLKNLQKRGIVNIIYFINLSECHTELLKKANLIMILGPDWVHVKDIKGNIFSFSKFKSD